MLEVLYQEKMKKIIKWLLLVILVSVLHGLLWKLSKGYLSLVAGIAGVYIWEKLDNYLKERKK